MTKNTRITLSLGLILASSTLHADTLPALGSKGGGMLLPEGKLKMVYKYIEFERNSMFDGSSEVTNKENLDAKAKVNVLILNYGVSKNLNIAVAVPHKQIEVTAKLGQNRVAIDNYLSTQSQTRL